METGLVMNQILHFLMDAPIHGVTPLKTELVAKIPMVTDGRIQVPMVHGQHILSVMLMRSPMTPHNGEIAMVMDSGTTLQATHQMSALVSMVYPQSIELVAQMLMVTDGQTQETHSQLMVLNGKIETMMDMETIH